MAYNRTDWRESETPLSADNMNNIEDGIEELFSQKVDKESGKVLSDNNYTTAEKTKLSGVEAHANNYSLTTTKKHLTLSSSTVVDALSGKTLTFGDPALTSAYALSEIELTCSASGICIAGWHYEDGNIKLKVFNASRSSITISGNSTITVTKYS